MFQLSKSGYQIGILARLDLNPFEILRGTHMLVRTIVHQDAYSVPILGLMGWLFVSNCCRDVSSFVLLTCILYVRMILGIILGNSRDLTCRGSRSSSVDSSGSFGSFGSFWLFQLFRLFGSFSSFGFLALSALSALSLAFSSLVFVVVWFTLARVFEPVIFGRIQLVCIFESTFFDHLANTSTSEATRFLPIGFALPFSFVDTAFFCRGIDLHDV